MRELEFCQCNELEFCALHSTEQSVVLHRIAAHWDGVFDLFRHIVGNESFDLIKLTSSSIQTGTLMYSFVSKSRTLTTRTEYFHVAFLLFSYCSCIVAKYYILH